MEVSRDRLDWSLLVEIALILILVALGIVLYWWPAAYGVLDPRWWHWAIIAVPFFAVVGLASYRRRVRGRVALRRQLRDETGLDE